MDEKGLLQTIEQVAEGGRTSLDLRYNRLTALPPEIGQLTNLTELNLGGNQLTTLPPEIAQLENLVYLNLEGDQLRHLPSALKRFENLKEKTALFGLLRTLDRERRSARQKQEEAYAQEVASREDRPIFTAVYPEIVVPETWYSLELFLYLKKYAWLVEQEIKRRQREFLDYGDVTSQSPKGFSYDTEIIISLTSDVIEANPSVTVISWLEDFYKMPFRIRYRQHETVQPFGILTIDISADDLPIASIPLQISASEDAEPSQPAVENVHWFSHIFASYAREDYQLVKYLKDRYLALGIYMFIDIDDLRSGDYWEARLFHEIESSDIFQLFWSHASKASTFVRREWQSALELSSRKGGGFIRPVYWEDPMPPIPPELASIHFHKLLFDTSSIQE